MENSPTISASLKFSSHNISLSNFPFALIVTFPLHFSVCYLSLPDSSLLYFSLIFLNYLHSPFAYLLSLLLFCSFSFLIYPFYFLLLIWSMALSILKGRDCSYSVMPLKQQQQQ